MGGYRADPIARKNRFVGGESKRVWLDGQQRRRQRSGAFEPAASQSSALQREPCVRKRSRVELCETVCRERKSKDPLPWPAMSLIEVRSVTMS